MVDNLNPYGDLYEDEEEEDLDQFMARADADIKARDAAYEKAALQEARQAPLDMAAYVEEPGMEMSMDEALTAPTGQVDPRQAQYEQRLDAYGAQLGLAPGQATPQIIAEAARNNQLSPITPQPGQPGASTSQSVDVRERTSGPVIVDKTKAGYELFTDDMLPDFTGAHSQVLGGAGAVAQGALSEAEAQDRYAQRVKDVTDEEERARANMKIERDLQQMEMRDHLRQSEEKIQAALDAVPKMERGQVWENTENFAKAGGILSAAIHGFLNPGKPNQTIQMMMEIVNQDMRAQQANIETMRQKVASAERSYGRTFDRLGVERKVMLENQLFKLETIRLDLRNAAADLQSDQAKANAEKVIGGLEMEIGKLTQQWQVQDAQLKMGAMEQRNKRLEVARAERDRRAALAQRKREFDEKNKPKAMERLITLPDGSKAYIPADINLSSEEKKDLRKAEAGYKPLMMQLDRAYDLVSKGERALTPNERAELAQLTGSITSLMRGETGANLGEKERGDLIARFGNYDNIWQSPEKTLELINRGKQSATDKMMHQFSGLELQRVKASGEVESLTPESFLDAYSDYARANNQTKAQVRRVKHSRTALKRTIKDMNNELDKAIDEEIANITEGWHPANIEARKDELREQARRKVVKNPPPALVAAAERQQESYEAIVSALGFEEEHKRGQLKSPESQEVIKALAAEMEELDPAFRAAGAGGLRRYQVDPISGMLPIEQKEGSMLMGPQYYEQDPSRIPSWADTMPRKGMPWEHIQQRLPDDEY